MDELNEMTYKQFLAEAGGEGKGESLSSEKQAEKTEVYKKLCAEESDMEKHIREERARAAAQRPVFLTF